MKVAFIGPAYPLRGGIAQFIAILANKLEANNHQVKVFSFKKQYPKLLFPGKEQVEKSSKVIKINIDSTLIPYNPLTFNKTINKINDYSPDVLILKYWIPFFAPAFGFILKRLKKRNPNLKILYIIDNIDFHEKWFMGDQLTRYAMKSSDYFISMSDSVYDSLFKLFPKLSKDRVFPLKHPTYDFYSDESTNINTSKINNKILFFGYIKAYKGLDLLLKAMPQIIKARPKTKLIVAGEVYGDESQYLDIIDELHLKDNVEFYNQYITNEEVKTFFENSDVCVLPYKHATQSGIIQLSYAFKVPVLASRIGGIPEVVVEGKTGNMFPANNIQAIVDSVISFYKDFTPGKYTKAIEEENRKYSWQPFVDVIEKL